MGKYNVHPLDTIDQMGSLTREGKRLRDADPIADNGRDSGARGQVL